MSLPRDTLLFGIALIAFGAWLETSGMGGWPFATAGLVGAVAGFLGSLVSTMVAASPASTPVDDEQS